jgi:hypothetical protein
MLDSIDLRMTKSDRRNQQRPTDMTTTSNVHSVRLAGPVIARPPEAHRIGYVP